MRTAIMVAILTILLSGVAQASTRINDINDDLRLTLEMDKVAHFGVGGVISAVAYRNLFDGKRNGKMKAFVVTAIIAFAKELYDDKDSKVTGRKLDWKDMVATDIGAFVVLVKF